MSLNPLPVLRQPAAAAVTNRSIRRRNVSEDFLEKSIDGKTSFRFSRRQTQSEQSRNGQRISADALLLHVFHFADESVRFALGFASCIVEERRDVRRSIAHHLENVTNDADRRSNVGERLQIPSLRVDLETSDQFDAEHGDLLRLFNQIVRSWRSDR